MFVELTAFLSVDVFLTSTKRINDFYLRFFFGTKFFIFLRILRKHSKNSETVRIHVSSVNMLKWLLNYDIRTNHIKICFAYVKQIFQNACYDRQSFLRAKRAGKCHGGEILFATRFIDSRCGLCAKTARRDCIGAAVRGWPQVTSRPSLAVLADCPQPCHAVEIIDPFAWITIQDWTWPEHWK